MHYLSKRDTSGWSTESAMPRQSTSVGSFVECGGYPYFSADLTKDVISDGQAGCAHNDPPLTENEPEGFENLFLHDVVSGSYSLVNLTPGSEVPANAQLQDTSLDFTHIVFSEAAKLTSSAPSGEVLYEWIGGHVRLVSVLPNGTAVPGELVDGAPKGTNPVGDAPFLHSVSVDGSRVIFESAGNLYERVNTEMEQSQLSPQGACVEPTMGCTVQVDASDTGGTGGGGHFIAATAQGTDIFFTAAAVKKLTRDTVPNSGQNLYEFDLETGKLTDLTPFASAQILGLLGVGQEGSAWHLYVAAEGSFGEANAEGLQAHQDAPNLYEFSQGAPVSFIATVAPGDFKDWAAEAPDAAASPNGRYLVFDSALELTGYDDHDVATGAPDQELFRYDSGAGRLVCVSCGPAAVRPTGPTTIDPVERSAFMEYGPGYLRRNVLNDGRVLFDTPNALVPGDVNRRADVYIYEGGQAQLISSGTGAHDSVFYEASGFSAQTGQEGEDVFFATDQHLLGSDTGNGPALYDARVAGGFPGNSGEGRSCESAEECKPPSGEPPAAPLLASNALLSGGNLPPPAGAPPVKALTRAQKLARALKACHGKRNKKKRAICEKRARRAHGRSK